MHLRFRLATASADKTAKVWDVDDGSLRKNLVGHSKGISDCAWTNDSKYLATASDDKARGSDCTCLLEASKPRFGPAPMIRQHEYAQIMKRSLQTRFASHLNIYKIKTSMARNLVQYYCLQLPQFTVATRVTSRPRRPPGLAQTLRLWDVESGESLVTFEGHSQFVFCCSFSPNSNKLARRAAPAPHASPRPRVLQLLYRGRSRSHRTVSCNIGTGIPTLEAVKPSPEAGWLHRGSQAVVRCRRDQPDCFRRISSSCRHGQQFCSTRRRGAHEPSPEAGDPSQDAGKAPRHLRGTRTVTGGRRPVARCRRHLRGTRTITGVGLV